MQKFVSVFLFLFACFFTYQSAKEIITTIQLKQEISENEQRIEDLKEQQVKKYLIKLHQEELVILLLVMLTQKKQKKNLIGRQQKH